MTKSPRLDNLNPIKMRFRTFWLSSLWFILSFAVGCGGGGSNASEEAELPQVPPPASAPGGSKNGSDASSDTSTAPPGSLVSVQPGEYARVSATPDCPLIAGSETAEFKLLFANLEDAPYFDEIVEDAIHNQFRELAPLKDYEPNFAFFRLALSNAKELGCEATGNNSGASFACDNNKVNEAFLQQCEVDDIHGVIKVVIADTGYGASGGEVIYFGSDGRWPDADTALFNLRNLVVHEVGHNFGLADLYDGGTNADGSAVTGWPSDLSREWHNLDGPGCAKWCNSFKPASEYTLSASAACNTFESRDACISHNRTESGECTTADGGTVACCSWSDEKEDDYFGSQCTPAWGTEDIGLDCLEGTGCYYGGAYGNNSWRPAKSWPDSIMYGAGHSDAFDEVSQRALSEIIRCCGTSDDATQSCSSFRAEYATFLDQFQPYKMRLGSCGVKRG
ncbi:hypothetical protein [uncultured Microbulbifer sp.]|uniref:hypothetical protein n=1 Tax=uncultured Microbulbifer sp. TaxID=348147 RepID=UPI00260A88AC|nr:hypothetical protein [uncultured Microbulbifer sp.]